MMRYNDIDERKKAFVFELDNVLYPEKDYLLQVYYLFASFLEYTEQIDAKAAVSLMTDVYQKEGKEAVFGSVKKEYQLDDQYNFNFDHLLINAKLPLKLLLFDEMLHLLQDIVVDRKQIFIVTNGDAQQQLNKIKQTDWNGLENYLTCYFTSEYAPKPEPDAVHALLHDHSLQRRDLLMIGKLREDELSAEASGIDYLDVANFIKN